MIKVLDTVYSLPFFCGALTGTVLWLLYCRAKARYLDRHNPLPDGHRHAVARMSRQWLAGLCAVLSLGYVLLSTEHAEMHTARLNQQVTQCWSETYHQIKAQVEINAQNDAVTREQQQLQREYDEDTSTWLKTLVNPPAELANLSPNSPERQAWGIKITTEYQTRLDDLGRQFDDLVARRANLDKERATHPLPEARCGKS